MHTELGSKISPHCLATDSTLFVKSFKNVRPLKKKKKKFIHCDFGLVALPRLHPQETDLSLTIVCIQRHSSHCLSACLFIVFLGLHLRHMEVLRLRVESELQRLASAPATAARDPSRVCSLHRRSRQHQILNPLSGARGRTLILMDTSQVHYP